MLSPVSRVTCRYGVRCNNDKDLRFVTQQIGQQQVEVEQQTLRVLSAPSLPLQPQHHMVPVAASRHSALTASTAVRKTAAVPRPLQRTPPQTAPDRPFVARDLYCCPSYWPFVIETSKFALRQSAHCLTWWAKDSNGAAPAAAPAASQRPTSEAIWCYVSLLLANCTGWRTHGSSSFRHSAHYLTCCAKDNSGAAPAAAHATLLVVLLT